MEIVVEPRLSALLRSFSLSKPSELLVLGMIDDKYALPMLGEHWLERPWCASSGIS